MADVYLVKDNISVNLSPTGRIEETLVNDLYTRDRGVARKRRMRLKEVQQVSISTGIGTVMTAYKILSVTAVWNNPGGTGTNYYTGGSFNFKTITLGSLGSLNDKDTVYCDYAVASGDTIIVDAGRVRDTFIITGNLVSDANGSMQTKKDNFKDIFNAGGNVSLTYPSQNCSINVFPTRITFVENCGELEQSELMMEAVWGHDKT